MPPAANPQPLPDTLFEKVVLREHEAGRLRLRLDVARAVMPAEEAARIELEQLILRSPGALNISAGEHPTRLQAPRGSVDIETRKLTLRGGVEAEVAGERGTLRMQAPEAHVDGRSRRADLVGPVRARFAPAGGTP